MTTEAEAAFLIDVGLRIRLLRTAHGVSQDRLADLSSMSRVTLGSMERGEQAAGTLTYRAVGIGLGVPLSLLFDDSADPELLSLRLSRRR